jgi:hypothetical protein
MNKDLVPIITRRRFLLGAATGMASVVGCWRGEESRVVTTRPKVEGTRRLLGLIKEKSAQSSPKRKTRKK